MHAAGEGLEGNRIIKLNVGGVRYATSVGTLSLENSYFSALFSGRWQQNLTDEGEVFLDRDGEVRAFRRAVDQWPRQLASARHAMAPQLRRHACLLLWHPILCL
jgi:hypothetical protein